MSFEVFGVVDADDACSVSLVTTVVVVMLPVLVLCVLNEVKLSGWVTEVVSFVVFVVVAIKVVCPVLFGNVVKVVVMSPMLVLSVLNVVKFTGCVVE